MSEYQRNIGKLYPVTETEVKRTLKNEGVLLKDYCDLREAALESFWDGEAKSEFIRLNGSWYKLEDHETPDPYGSYAKITYNEEGKYFEFDACFYNGGTYLEEMLEKAMENK